MNTYTLIHDGELREYIGNAPTVEVTTTATLPVAGALRVDGNWPKFLAVEHVETGWLYLLPWAAIVSILAKPVEGA